MKTRFSSLDIACIVKEVNNVLIGMRVNQIYDIDHKTFLIKFAATDKKYVLILESGNRIHLTTFDWPKNDHPSGFSMKLRKHLRNKRLEKIKQLGQDRIVDLEFGTGEVSFHIFLELFDKGNIVLTDHQLAIVHLLRPHSEGHFKFMVREPYPLDRVKLVNDFDKENLSVALKSAADGELLKKVLIPYIDYGPSIAEHILLVSGFKKGDKVKGSLSAEEVDTIVSTAEKEVLCINELITSPAKGYIIKRKETKADGEVFFSNIEFQPYLFKQYSSETYSEYDNFNTAVDEFFSQMGSQKIDMKALQEEKAALKKVEKIKLDQAARLVDLNKKQLADTTKAELLMCNIEQVDAAITAIRSALAAQMPWNEISELVSDAHARKDPIGSLIKKLKLESNSITLQLHNPFAEEEDNPGGALVDVDLELSAYGNVKRYYDDKKFACNKQLKTIHAQSKVLKTAEKKVESALKDIQTNANITKSRTVFWFEKFLWFISSENFIIIGSRDKIQIELIIRRYMHEGDIFVHSDIPDASCFLIKNPTKGIVPPKTLNEAGTMVVCFSSAWEAHIISNAWWVHSSQISKTHSNCGPAYTVTAEKNYLMPAQLAIGFGFIFYIDSSCIERHQNERVVKFNPDSLNEKEDDQAIESQLEDISIDDDTAEVNISPSVDSEVIDNASVKNASEEDTSDSESSDEEGDKVHSDNGEGDVQDDNSVSRVSESNSVDLKEVSGGEPTSKGFQKKKQTNNKNKQNEPPPKPHQENVLKRGQRSKLKKIQEKYKDQDEEEKMLRMAILQSAGTKKESKKKNKHSKQQGTAVKVKNVPKRKVVDESSGKVELDDIDVPAETDISMLNQLTGIPHQEDKIIFAMPIVAPYNTLIPYKFRVKMIPGTSKRGKSARSALNIFLNNKESSEQEKAVMKNVNDQILCRDLPGKIKLSIGQQAAKFKKKK